MKFPEPITVGHASFTPHRETPYHFHYPRVMPLKLIKQAVVKKGRTRKAKTK